MAVDEQVPMTVPEQRTPRPGPGRRLIAALRIASARLRLLAVFAIVFAVIGGWETIRAYWARLTTSATTAGTISSDTEFFCPMDPGILSDWPSKCPVCNMTLVRRKRGDATPMPDGVVARMQFSPYRLWLGGIRTAAVDYAPLARTLEAPGTITGVSPLRVEAEFYPRERVWLASGQAAEILPARDEAATVGKVVEVGSHRVIVEVGGRLEGVQPGDRVRVRVRCPVERIEPFRDRPSVPPPLASGEPRRLYVCMEHDDIVRDAPGRCPKDQSELMARSLLANQRIRWWCSMHPDVTADRPGSKCDACGGMALVPRAISYRLPGTVLSVPCTAVIDDGSRAIVYLDRGAGMFDGRVVTVGPRCGDSFPVVAGLEPGDRVAAQGAFLIDAETRLNPALAAGYFGAGEGASARGSAPTKPPSTEAWLDGLIPGDRPSATRQKVCPVTGKALGSMGVPMKFNVRGRGVFLCCDGCAPAIEADPEKYLAKLPRDDSERRP
jgi:hypothetical protein